jgi:hypothetical protein
MTTTWQGFKVAHNVLRVKDMDILHVIARRAKAKGKAKGKAANFPTATSRAKADTKGMPIKGKAKENPQHSKARAAARRAQKKDAGIAVVLIISVSARAMEKAVESGASDHGRVRRGELKTTMERLRYARYQPYELFMKS